MLAVIVLAILASAGPEMENADFESGLEGWTTKVHPAVQVQAARVQERTAAHIKVPAEAAAGYPNIHQQFAATAGAAYEGSADVLAAEISRGAGAYLALEFIDAQGARICYSQSDFATVPGRWVRLSVYGIAPPEVHSARLTLIVNGCGEAWFDSVQFNEVPADPACAPDGPVTVQVSDTLACQNFKGFGAEDDGWFYNGENASHGVDAADAALREQRIEWMSPDYVRMFCWYKDWNSSSDWETFDFESPAMQSRYKTLDLYQRLGSTVNLTGVEWGIKNNPYAEPEKVAKALGELFEYLIKVKGYTCVREWTLTNEPNTNWMRRGGSFESFVKIHQLVKQQFMARGLNVAVVGSDDTSGDAWFSMCVEEKDYFEVADLFCSHRYCPFPDRRTAGRFFDYRLNLLEQASPVKPLVVAEFGFQDSRSSTAGNPLMEEYRYAVWTSAFAIEGLNAGVSGFCIWALHEVYYPVGLMMNYALWNYKDREWSLRPVYYAWADFCRLTNAGDPVYRCQSSHPAIVQAAKIGDTFFWVNHSDHPAQVKVDGMSFSHIQTNSEGPAGKVTQTGSKVDKATGFNAPPMSFGYCR